MASRFLSKSKFISKFLSIESRAFSVLKEQQQNSNNKLKKKLVVGRRHKRSINLLSIGENDNFSNYFSWHHPYDDFFPEASCNNKLLLLGKPYDDFTVCERAVLWNPTTGKINTLPRTGSEHLFDHHYYHFYGFGFDSTDYKVIRVIQDFAVHVEDCTVELYSLKTNSWKQFECPSKHVFPVIEGPSLFINGSCHWPVSYIPEIDPDEYDYNYDSGILRFDFANEEFSSPNIPLPDNSKLSFASYRCQNSFLLAEFEGSLAFVVYSSVDEFAEADHEKPFEFEIWVWNDESLSWAKRGEWVIIISSSVAGVECPLGLFNSHQLYLRDLLGELLLFDCATGELKNLGLKFDQTNYETKSIFAYVESSAEEVIHRENENKPLSNSTTFISKLAPIVNDLKQKPHSNNKPKLMIIHGFEETLYLSRISLTDNYTLKKDSDNVLFNFPRFGAYFKPAASCNSALLLCYIDYDCRAALWNPTTDEVKKLPDQLSSPKAVNSTIFYGFGFDPKSESNYKVIRFIRNEKSEKDAELYSLKADSWKGLTSSISIFDKPTQPSLYVNGFCYWVTSRYYIISFDFANENFSSAPHIPLPKPNCYVKNKHFHTLLAEFHGYLAALVYPMDFRDEKKEPFELEIWVWRNNDESSSWTRVSVIHVPAGVKKPLGLFGNDQLYLRGLDGEVLLFDCAKGGELKRLGLSDNLAHSFGEDCIFPYVESSFPLNEKKIIRASHKKIIND